MKDEECTGQQITVFKCFVVYLCVTERNVILRERFTFNAFGVVIFSSVRYLKISKHF